MDRNIVTILTLAGGGLLAAVSIGFVLRGPPGPDATPSPLIVPPAPPQAERPANAGAPIPQPRSDRTVPEKEDAPTYTVVKSGLGFYDWSLGDGPQPQRGDYVLVEYTGWLDTGAMVDSTFTRDEGFVFAVGMGETIPGLDQAVSTMRVGGKRQAKIPPQMAYGQRGRPPVIPPNATLTYDIELIGILPPRSAPEAPAETAADCWTERPNGLAVCDIEIGEGPEVTDGMLVMLDYTGWFTDGKKFDSSLDRARPLVIALGKGHVMEGWEEGIPGMRVGGKRQLKIPAELAYGEKGRDPVVPPNSSFVFDIEIVQARPIESIGMGPGPGGSPPM